MKIPQTFYWYNEANNAIDNLLCQQPICITQDSHKIPHLISWCENFVESETLKTSELKRETLRKPCVSTKFPHHEIRWNYGIFCSAGSGGSGIEFLVYTLFPISPLAQHKFHLMLHCSSTARICSWQLLKTSSLAEIIFPKFEISYSIFVCFATFGNGLIIYIRQKYELVSIPVNGWNCMLLLQIFFLKKITIYLF